MYRINIYKLHTYNILIDLISRTVYHSCNTKKGILNFIFILLNISAKDYSRRGGTKTFIYHIHYSLFFKIRNHYYIPLKSQLIFVQNQITCRMRI